MREQGGTCVAKGVATAVMDSDMSASVAEGMIYIFHVFKHAQNNFNHSVNNRT